MGIFVETTLYGALAVAVITVFRTIFRTRLPKSCFVILWEIALLRFVLPVSFDLPILPAQTEPEQIISGEDFSAYAQTSSETFIYSASEPTEFKPASQKDRIKSGDTAVEDKKEVSKIITEAFLWKILIAGTALTAAFLTAGYILTLRKLRRAKECESEAVKAILGENGKISVRVLDGIPSALTYGIARPVIVLPKEWERFPDFRLEMILEHELSHIRRKDSLRKLVFAAAVSLHWFNPFAWAMWRLYSRDLEGRCDEDVIKKLGKDKKSSYAKLLIAIEESRSFGTPLLSCFAKNSTEERIISIMKFKKTTVLSIITSSLLIATVSATVIASSVNPVPKEEEKFESESVSYEPKKNNDGKASEKPVTSEDEIRTVYFDGDGDGLPDSYDLKKDESVYFTYAQEDIGDYRYIPVELGIVKVGDENPADTVIVDKGRACAIFSAPEDGEYNFYVSGSYDGELPIKLLTVSEITAPLHTDTELYCFMGAAAGSTDEDLRYRRGTLCSGVSMIQVHDVITDGVSEMDEKIFKKGERAALILDFQRPVPEEYLSVTAGFIREEIIFTDSGEPSRGPQTRYSLGEPFIYDETCLIFPFEAPEDGYYFFHVSNLSAPTAFIPGRWVEAENSGEEMRFGKIKLDVEEFNPSCKKWAGLLDPERPDKEVLAEMTAAAQKSSSMG